MSLSLLLTACALGANPAPIPQSGWPSHPVPGYASATDLQPSQPQAYPSYPSYPSYPTYPVGGYVSYPPAMPMQQPYWPVMPVGGCMGGNCGPAGCGAPACAPMYAPMCAPTCDDGCQRKRLFGCFRHKRDDCEMPCGQPDYKACAKNCKAIANSCDSCDCRKPRCGLLSRLRNLFKRKNDCCQSDCNTCCKPSLRDRLKKCFAKDDCCEDTCCKPTLHDRLRAAFKRCKKQDDCCCTAAASPAAGKAEPIKAPKEMPKEMPKDAKEPAGVRGPLPKGPPVHISSEVPF